jgi:hypothetical protein
MDDKTKNLLAASKFVLDQTDNPETGGRDMIFALEDLRSAVADFDGE